jgi:putative transcriptional regulator
MSATAGAVLRDTRIMVAGFQIEDEPMAKVEDPGFPTPEEVKAARAASGLTQSQAAQLLYSVIDNWQNWEQGRYPMAVALFELFLLKTGQFTLREAVPTADHQVLRLRLRSGRIIEMSVKHAVVKDIADAVDDA